MVREGIGNILSMKIRLKTEIQGCVCVCVCLSRKYSFHQQSEDILTGPHNLKLMLKCGLKVEILG